MCILLEEKMPGLTFARHIILLPGLETRSRLASTRLGIEISSGASTKPQVISGQVLARLSSRDAQQAIADMALSEANSPDIRVAAFGSLAISAKINARLLTDEQVDAIYELISSDSTDPVLRSAAASAYGALNLPSKKVKTLILDQSIS